MLDEQSIWRLPDEAKGGIYRDISARFMLPVDEALVRKEAATPKRKYLGGSAIGDPCERAVRIGHKAKAPIEDPQLLRRFAHGHAVEDLYKRHFGLAYDLITEGEDGAQFGFEALDGLFRGHIDGFFRGTVGGFSSPWGFPALWEHKGLNASGFAQVKRVGVYQAYPKYYAQANLYAHMVKPTYQGEVIDLTRNPIIFTVSCKDDDRVYVEAIVPNRANARYHYERAVRILNDGLEPFDVPRYSVDRNNFVCKMCPYRDTCHGPAPKDFY